MLDYFAAGLPVVSTPAGARGLDVAADQCIVCSADEFVARIQALLNDAVLREKIGARARQVAVEQYDWTAIAERAAGAMRDLIGRG
jgi:glycosyltransferase involved in cell wall biosynthesis